ncbi:unnamed protein product [Mytilus coruscus]|uniref:Protein Wnt n=1 Tax=Mytilus coruscus TaxID=42192 RepID=A0A6J8D5N4_MYTCO|nr:unnamed protein product [Mytilus coruscus]
MIRSYLWISLFTVCSFNIYTSKSWSLNEILITGPKVGLAATNYTRNPDLFTRHPVEAKILESVRKGTLKAQEECQHQFKWERWNCPADTAPFDQDFGEFVITLWIFIYIERRKVTLVLYTTK